MQWYAEAKVDPEKSSEYSADEDRDKIEDFAEHRQIALGSQVLGNQRQSEYIQEYIQNFEAPKKRESVSLLHQIKQDMKIKTKTEVLIRKFNLKKFDDVIRDLTSHAQPQGEPASPEEVEKQEAELMGQFLFSAQGCDKEMKGYFFGQDKKRHTLAFTAFLQCFRFKNLSVETCWRLVFTKTGLPKEGQQICRLIELFQEVYLEHNQGSEHVKEWPEDTVWTLTVKLFDLNTNLHNPNVKAMLRYSKETFVSHTLQLLKNAVSPKELGELYENILNKKFESNITLNEKYIKRINEIVYLYNVNQDSHTRHRTPVMKGMGKSILGRHNLKEVFHSKGTVFLKYGRYGKPKRRVVYLSEAETEILWKDPTSKEKARGMLVTELETVIIGSDHTQVMRKHKDSIPTHLDNCCISIIGKHRTLDLMSQDPEMTQLWESKVKQLIDADSKLQVVTHCSRHEGEEHLEFHFRDTLPLPLVYLWKNEILNNWQKYWRPIEHSINHRKEVFFQDEGLREAVLEVIQRQGGFLKTSKNPEEREEQELKAVQPLGGPSQNASSFVASCLPSRSNGGKQKS